MVVWRGITVSGESVEGIDNGLQSIRQRTIQRYIKGKSVARLEGGVTRGSTASLNTVRRVRVGQLLNHGNGATPLRGCRYRPNPS